MADSSWDNGGQSAPRKQGMSTVAKVALGCGVVALLGLATCIGGMATCAGAISKSMDGREWGDLRAAVAQLQTEEGAKALYGANQDLWKDYPSEEKFLATARSWRPRLEPLPEKMPSLLTGKINYNVNVSNGLRTVELGYTNGKGAQVASRWANGRLQTLTVN